ncbi:MAG: hypothetical protein IJ781_01625 [Atopobiaceae bacterium]|nr:hypothetical protein [Atopobiaceae bacterium]
MDVKEWFEGLTEDLQTRVKACKSLDELKAVMADAGTELSDDVLDGLAGGGWYCKDNAGSILCPANCAIDFVG